MGVSFLGGKLDYPRFDSWQQPDIFLFFKMPTQPPIQLGVGAFTGIKAVAAWEWLFAFKCWIQLHLHSTYMPS